MNLTEWHGLSVSHVFFHFSFHPFPSGLLTVSGWGGCWPPTGAEGRKSQRCSVFWTNMSYLFGTPAGEGWVSPACWDLPAYWLCTLVGWLAVVPNSGELGGSQEKGLRRARKLDQA